MFLIKKQQIYILLVLMMGSLFSLGESAHAAVKERFTVTPGVEYHKDQFDYYSKKMSSDVMTMDLTRPEIKVEAGVPNPINTLATVSARAKVDSRNGHSVVGAINASFYHFASRMPAYLVAENNKVSTYGVISAGSGEYMSVPAAFGVTADGKAQADTFDYVSSFEVNGMSMPVASVNKVRGSEEAIVYTPSFSYPTTRTNTAGMEIIVSTLSNPVDSGELGKPTTGIVQEVRSYGQGDSVIPHNGYVLSIQGGAKASRLAGVKAGDRISLTIDVDSRWKNSQFMLASGPLLVQDGKANLTMDANSYRAKSREPRTAVAVDQTGKRVFFVTVDGRQPGFSEGMTLLEFAHYLASLGAHSAINLDGGGSTTMVTRRLGDLYPTVMNSPSGGSQRSISTILQAVTTSPAGVPLRMIVAANHQSALIGSTIIVTPKLQDSFMKDVPFPEDQVKYTVEGNIGRMSGHRFVAEQAGSGAIVAQYGSFSARLPITVEAAPARVEIEPKQVAIGAESTQKFTMKAYSQSGQELEVNPSMITWSADSAIGVMKADGIFTAGTKAASGKVRVAFNGKPAGESAVAIYAGAIPAENFEEASMWSSSAIRASGQVAFMGAAAPHVEGINALKLQYDLRSSEGTAAAYADRKSPIVINGLPNYLGMWVYGDGKNHWLRGKMTDGAGKEFALNFTEESQLNWTGWKYVKTSIPATAQAPLKVSSLYVVETSKAREGSGVIYMDKLQAEYGTRYVEPALEVKPEPEPVDLFTDVTADHWAKKEVEYLAERSIITGYGDGTFKPESTLSRAHAAVILSRVLKLNTTTVTDPGYKDVSRSHLYFGPIAATANAGVITGKYNQTIFDPDNTLTRGQMAAILTRAYKLEGMPAVPITDVKNTHWAYKEIHALAANGITNPYPDGSFKPENQVTRAQFSAFVYRILTK
ncbi:uncharacterized protein YigE (DUF2233 family) [Bacillus ectoiniformans]|uniref:S-layer homology domain-containing protein n=1 Tax=Bacillus ectoiniformans TaxID=1494429 RepID=UPI0019577375|nr:S-layer homology domain-containing protein [Bacillus ectoiniformans]MBM7649324.1 uncharacterized protein YigE (DUF2233 family) [Bacillus ectoiniformans]